MTIDTLRHVPLFESLDDEAARKLCQLLQSIDCKAKTSLFRAREPIATHRRTFASERYAQCERGRSGAAYVRRSRVGHYRGVWRQLEIHHCCSALFQRVGIDKHLVADQ